MTRFMCLVGALSCLLTACGGGEDTPGGYAESCTLESGCGKGLTCNGGICTAACTTTMDCTKWSMNSICDTNNFCYIECNTSILSCPADTQCNQSSTSPQKTCRVPL